MTQKHIKYSIFAILTFYTCFACAQSDSTQHFKKGAKKQVKHIEKRKSEKDIREEKKRAQLKRTLKEKNFHLPDTTKRIHRKN